MRKQAPHSQRTAIADFICPDNGYRGKLQRMGQQPKDHMKENMKELKSRMEKVREDREEASRAPKELYKLTQFKNVQSKVFEETDNDTQPVHNEFLSKGSQSRRMEELMLKKKQDRIDFENRLEGSATNSPRKSNVPRADEAITFAPRQRVDFVNRNKISAITTAPSRNDIKDEEVLHEEFGRVPKYLEQRKLQAEEIEREKRRNAPDPNCPPGMKIMPESERQNTLAVLNKNKEEALHQLGKMPFVVETPSLMRRKAELEGKLREIEKAIEIFSKPKVYIQI